MMYNKIVIRKPRISIEQFHAHEPAEQISCSKELGEKIGPFETARPDPLPVKTNIERISIYRLVHDAIRLALVGVIQ